MEALKRRIKYLIADVRQSISLYRSETPAFTRREDFELHNIEEEEDSGEETDTDQGDEVEEGK